MNQHNEYNTNLYPEGDPGEYVLYNEYCLEIAHYDSGEDKVTWRHRSISEQAAERIIGRQLEWEITGSHWQGHRHYDTFHFRSHFHATAVALTNGTRFREALKDVTATVKRLNTFAEHAKVCALNPSQFADVGQCCFCNLSCTIHEMTLIGIGVPLLEDERTNIHGENNVAINPVCSECAEGVAIE